MKIAVPKSVNVNELVERSCLSPTRKENLKNKIYYFLSRVVETNDNFRLYEKSEGYRNISSAIMRQIMGRKDFYFILRLLTDPVDQIIESNGSWRNPNGKGNVGHCKGYRLTTKYNTGEIEFKTIPEKYSRRIMKHTERQKSNMMTDKYHFLLNQFQSHKLSLDPKVYDYIWSFGWQLLVKVKKSNEYQIRMVYNLIGRWLYLVEQIEKGAVWKNVSEENHRLNSSITILRRTLRPFLLCDSVPLGMVDISASQPYFLSSIIDTNFLYDSGPGFNLGSIYPELILELRSKGYNFYGNEKATYTGIKHPADNCLLNTSIAPQYGCIDISNTPARFIYKTYSGSTINPEFISNASSRSQFSLDSSSFIWGQFYSQPELDSIMKYKQSPFYDDFYKYLYESFQATTGTGVAFNYEIRERLKDSMWYILFQANWNHRNKDKILLLFQKLFPGVDKWICSMLKTIGKTRLSYILQRAESYLVLDVACREFNQRFPDAPVFTIHDAVLTHEIYLPDLTRLILERFYETTGIMPGIKTTSEKIDSVPKLVDIEEEWSKIKTVESQKNYEKDRGIFTTNITKGADFLAIPRKLDSQVNNNHTCSNRTISPQS